MAERESADYYEDLLAELAKAADKPAGEVATKAANWVISDLFGALNKAGLAIADSPVSAAQGAELLQLVGDGTISGRMAKDVFEEMFDGGRGAAEIVAEKGLKQVSDSGELEAIIDQIMADNPAQVEQFRAGKDRVLGFFVGQVMKATSGNANPKVVNELLAKKLKG